MKYIIGFAAFAACICAYAGLVVGALGAVAFFETGSTIPFLVGLGMAVAGFAVTFTLPKAGPGNYAYFRMRN